MPHHPHSLKHIVSEKKLYVSSSNQFTNWVLSQLLPQNVTIGRIDSLIIILHQFALLKPKLFNVKVHCVRVGCLDMKHDFVNSGCISFCFRFYVFKSGFDKVRSDAVVAIGGEHSEGHYVEAMSPLAVRNRFHPRTDSTDRKSIPIREFAQVFIRIFCQITVEGFIV